MDERMFAWVERGEYNKIRGEEWRNDFNDADCVRKHENGWADDWYTSARQALCSKRILNRCTVPTESTHTGVCIRITPKSVTFNEAHEVCLSHNGTFADSSILSLLTNLTVQNGSKVWIGVHDLHLEGYLMNMKNDSVCLGTEWRGVLLENNEDTDCMSYDTQHGKVRMEPCSISLPPVCFSSPGARCTNGYTSSYPNLPQTTEESTTLSPYLSTTEESVSTYLSTTVKSTPISTYLLTTVESTPISTYLSTTVESTSISTYLSTTVESTPVLKYLSTTVESTPVSTYLSTTVESTPISTYLSTTVESTPVSTEESISMYLSTTVESTMTLTTEAGTSTTTHNLKGCLYRDLNFDHSTTEMFNTSQLPSNA
ncbi:mucin-17-like, partial [Saccostrea cucullata]|uniref:mucin-17-like n=1 Tax=Saccostrea cuccullata TaxID=36930 RepID=UPI002ED32427